MRWSCSPTAPGCFGLVTSVSCITPIPYTPEFASACPLPPGWSWAAQTQPGSAGRPNRGTQAGPHQLLMLQALSEAAALGTDLRLSGGHKLKDNMFEVLKVDLSWVVQVHRVGHHDGGGWRTACWWGVRTNLLLLVCSAFWKSLLSFRVWIRFQLLESTKGWIQTQELVQATKLGSHVKSHSPAPSGASSSAQPASAAAAWWSEKHVCDEGSAGLHQGADHDARPAFTVKSAPLSGIV